MLIKKFAFVLLAALLILGILGYSSGNARAASSACDLVHPDMTLSAKCPEIFFVWGWAAMTKGQINEFLSATQDSLTLRDGSGNVLNIITPNQVAQSWGPAYPVDPADLGVTCGMPQAWVTDSMVSLGHLDKGNYTLTVERVFTHPLTDGFNACLFDGFKIPVSLYSGSGSFTAAFTVK